MEWYKQKLRRNLVDMHIEDWNEEFLSKFDPEEYVENLKIANINAAMLYLQSHVGLCNWPTKSGKMHNAFIGCEDKVKRVEQLCHRNGIAVIAYYSLIYDNWAHEHHPDWRQVNLNGIDSRPSYNDRYGQCCPNNMDYRAYTEAQIREICEYFDFEGIYFDMLFWTRVCHCPSCQARWAKEVGGELPTVIDWNDPSWKLFQKKRTEWLGEYAQWVTDTVGKYKPGAHVQHQYSGLKNGWSAGVNQNIALASAYSGGDFYGDIESHSFVCKLYSGTSTNQPFEYQISRAFPALQEHTTTKTYDMMRQAVMLTCAHHGASMVIDAIDPIGTLDRRVYERIGQVYAEAEKYEKVMGIGSMAYDVALYYDMDGKYDPDSAPVPTSEHNQSKSGAMFKTLARAAKALRSQHIAYDVVNSYYFDRYRKARVLALCDLSDPASFDAAKADDVLDYVRNGGGLYMSGRCSPKLLKEIFGLECTGKTEADKTYISPTKAGDVYMEGHFTNRHPLVMFERQYTVAGTPKGVVLGTLTLPYTVDHSATGAQAILEPGYEEVVERPENERLRKWIPFASIHSNPPGVFTDEPAMVYAEYGKGKCVWSAAPIERPDREQHRLIFARLIEMLCGGQRSFTAEASEQVECILFDAPEKKMKVMSVNNLFLGSRIPPAYDITVSVPCEAEPKEVRLVAEDEPLAFTWQDGKCTVHFDKVDCCVMYTIQM